MIRIIYFADKHNELEINRITNFFNNKNITFSFNKVVSKEELELKNDLINILFVSSNIYDTFLHEILNKNIKLNGNIVIAPVSLDTKNDVLETAYNNAISKKQNTIIPVKNGVKEINVKDILYFEIVDRCMYVKTNSEYFKSTLNMAGAIKITEDFSFASPYVSFLVNFDWIGEITSNNVILKNSDIIPLSQKKASHFRKIFSTFLSNLL